MIWFLWLVVPAVIRFDLIISCPYFTYTTVEWEITVREGNTYTHAGLRAQQEWLWSMLILFAPFLFISIAGFAHNG